VAVNCVPPMDKGRVRGAPTQRGPIVAVANSVEGVRASCDYIIYESELELGEQQDAIAWEKKLGLTM